MATLVINLVFFNLYGKLEILASLLVCYALFLVLRSGFAFLFIAVVFYQFDPSPAYFDYPFSAVATCVAQGVILRKHGVRVATASGCLSMLGLVFVPPPTVYGLVMLLPAIWIVAWAGRPATLCAGWLEWLGRYPLTIYLAQYLLIIGIDRR